MKRTDIHRPSAPEFDPQSYELRGCFDLTPEWPDTISGPERMRVVNECIAEGYTFHGAAHGMGQCSHCGAYIRYAALMIHPSTHCMLWIGETCLDNRFDLTKGQFQALRQTAKLNRKRKSKLELIQSAIDTLSAEARIAYDWAVSWEYHLSQEANGNQNYIPWDRTRSLAWDVASRITSYASPLSEKQEAFLVKLFTDFNEREAKNAEKAAQVAAGTIQTVPVGRTTVTGTILSTKRVDTPFGLTIKMLVEDERGFRVFGTVPSLLLNSSVELKGAHVTFTANLEPKANDPTFGFFSRPSKASITHCVSA